VPRDFGRLVESTRAFPRTMKRNRHDKIRVVKYPCAGDDHEPGEWTRERSMAGVLQRVNDRSQGSVVLTNRAPV